MNNDDFRIQAELEDRLWYPHALRRHAERELSRALLPGRSAVVLDAACGLGGLVAWMRPRHADWTWDLAEASSECRAFSRQRLGLEVADAAPGSLPFDRDRFDAVLACDAIGNGEPAAAALADLFRVLRPGGVAVLNVQAATWLQPRSRPAVGPSLAGFAPEELRARLVEAGFRGIQVNRWNTLAAPALRFGRQPFPPILSTGGLRAAPWYADLPLRGLAAAERTLISGGGRLWWGLSLLAVGRKPLASGMKGTEDLP